MSGRLPWSHFGKQASFLRLTQRFCLLCRELPRESSPDKSLVPRSRKLRVEGPFASCSVPGLFKPPVISAGKTLCLHQRYQTEYTLMGRRSEHLMLAFDTLCGFARLAWRLNFKAEGVQPEDSQLRVQRLKMAMAPSGRLRIFSICQSSGPLEPPSSFQAGLKSSKSGRPDNDLCTGRLSRTI